MRRLLSTIVCLLLGVAAPQSAAWAQEQQRPASNADVMGVLAAECALSVAPAPGPVRVSGLQDAPFIRSAVFTALVGSGFTVYDPNATVPGLPHLDLAAEVLSVTYEPADRHHLTRRVEVRLHTYVTEFDGTVLRDSTCTRMEEAVVARSAVPGIEDPANPRTHGVLPPAGGFLRRVVQPAVIGAATAAGVFLFFSLRSRRAGSGE